MLKMLMNGAILLGMLSCKNAPTIKKPLTMYAVNQEFDEAATGKRYLNYKLKKSLVGEWVDPDNLQFISLQDAPNNMMCFSLEDWLKVVKPELKRASQYYRQQSN